MKRKGNRIHPDYTNYTGIVGQIVTEFDEDGVERKYITSGIIYIADKSNKVYVITVASSFVHSYEMNSWLYFEYAKRSTIFLARDELNEYWLKASLKDYKIHPAYLKHPGLSGGFDVAVASFDISNSKSFIKELPTFKNMLSKLVPSLPKTFNMKKNDQVFLTGYPGETGGWMFQIKTQIYDFIDIEQVTQIIVLKDIKTSGGLSGSPILKIDENKTELLGIYVGYDQSWCVEICTIINKWVLEVINERLIIDDLKKKHTFNKNKTLKKNIKLNKVSEQGEVGGANKDHKQDISGELDQEIMITEEVEYLDRA